MSAEALPTVHEIMDKVAAKAAAAPGEGTAETPKEEPPVTTEVAADAPKPAPRDSQAARFAALARKDKEIRQMQEGMTAREKALADKEKVAAERETRMASAKKNPIQLLKEHGYSYADATEAVLGNYKEPEDDPVDRKLRPFEERVSKSASDAEQLAKKVQELEGKLLQREQQEAYSTVMSEIKTALKDADRYELINAIGDDAVTMVRDVIGEYARTHNKWLDYNEACDIVEKYYEDGYLTRIASTKKFTARIPKPAAKPDVKSQQKPATERATLTNAMSTGIPDKVDVDKLNKDDALDALLRKHMK